MLLTLRWSLSHQLLSIKLPLVHLRMGKRHACTLYADRSLNDIEPRASTNNPLHESEVTAWNLLRGPQPDNQVLHGQFSRLVQFDQLLQLIDKGHRIIRRQILRPKMRLRRLLLLSPVELGNI